MTAGICFYHNTSATLTFKHSMAADCTVITWSIACLTDRWKLCAMMDGLDICVGGSLNYRILGWTDRSPEFRRLVTANTVSSLDAVVFPLPWCNYGGAKPANSRNTSSSCDCCDLHLQAHISNCSLVRHELGIYRLYQERKKTDCINWQTREYA